MGKILEYAKFLASIGGAGLIVAQQAVPMSPTAHGWTAAGIAMATAVLVYRVPNRKPQQ